jgi:hypothetical protein
MSTPLFKKNKQEFHDDIVDFRKLIKDQKNKQASKASKEMIYIQNLRKNFVKMKEDYEKNREEAFKALKKKIKSDLNENKVYNEIAKVKAILARQINELKALCKVEFSQREKADNEILQMCSQNFHQV